jgi:hypothetical protein
MDDIRFLCRCSLCRAKNDTQEKESITLPFVLSEAEAQTRAA